MSQDAPQDDIDTLSDAEVLLRTDHGRYGPAIVGKALADRAARILKATGGGLFGPAITDPEFGRNKPAPRVEGAPDPDPSAPPPPPPNNPGDPWDAVTLSGAKVLAQRAGVSYKPGVKRVLLIAQLQKAGVVPPALAPDTEQ